MNLLARRVSALIALVGVAAVLVPASSATSHQTVLPTIYVEYAMNCTFRLHDDAGTTVTSIAPGTYRVYVTTPVVFAMVDLTGVNDMTACRSFVEFRLTGPGVSIATTLQEGDEDRELFQETFQAGGTYLAQDLNQPAVARATLTTFASGSPAGQTSPYNPTTGAKTKSVDVVGSDLRGTLLGQIDTKGRLTLTLKGNRISSLKSGRYRVIITDRSRNAAFSIQRAGKVAVTLSSLPYVGKRDWTVQFAAGSWTFYSSITRKNRFTVVA